MTGLSHSLDIGMLLVLVVITFALLVFWVGRQERHGPRHSCHACVQRNLNATAEQRRNGGAS